MGEIIVLLIAGLIGTYIMEKLEPENKKYIDKMIKKRKRKEDHERGKDE